MIGMAALGEDIAQVAEHRGIVRIVFDGFADIAFRLGQFVLLVESPAHAIEISGVGGILGPSARLQHIHGFIQPHAALRQHIAVIVERRAHCAD